MTNAEILAEIQAIELSIVRAMRELNIQIARGHIVPDGYGTAQWRVKDADKRIAALRAQLTP